MPIPKECPGTKLIKQPVPEHRNCQKCREEVEIWSDELMTTCSNCGAIVSREMGNSCIEWCKYAEQCVGEELYKKIVKKETT